MADTREVGVSIGDSPAAYTRKKREPIYIDRHSKGNAVSGEYIAPNTFHHAILGLRDSELPDDKAAIRLAAPQSLRRNPTELSRVLKHELVHSILGDNPPPLDDQHGGSLRAAPGIMGWLAHDPVTAPGPYNQYNFADWRRAGDAQHEVPAYMLTGSPEETPGITDYQRQTYTGQLLNAVDPNRGAALRSLVDSLKNMRAIYPRENVR